MKNLRRLKDRVRTEYSLAHEVNVRVKEKVKSGDKIMVMEHNGDGAWKTKRRNKRDGKVGSR